MSVGPRPRINQELVDGVIVVSFTDTKLVTEDPLDARPAGDVRQPVPRPGV